MGTKASGPEGHISTKTIRAVATLHYFRGVEGRTKGKVGIGIGEKLL